jgi:hypothetical protein
MDGFAEVSFPPDFKTLRGKYENHPLEKMGLAFRKMFSWKK